MADLQFCLEKNLNMEYIGAEKILRVMAMLQLCPEQLCNISRMPALR